MGAVGQERKSERVKTSAHNLVSVAIAAPVGCLAHHYTRDGVTALCVAAGCVSGIWFSPDLDLGERRKMRSKNWPWVLFWRPYALAIKHRSFWSHFPIVGTLVRLLYFFGIIGAVMYTLGWWDVFVALPWGLIAWWAVGLAVDNSAHWIMDVLGSN